jgi:hypothetical protein
MGDKRRYLPRDPSPRRDHRTAEHGTGKAITDGYTVRHRCELPGEESSSYRRKDSLYRESYAADSVMDDDDARMQRIFGEET